MFVTDSMVFMNWFSLLDLLSNVGMLSRISLVRSDGLKLGLCDLSLVRCVEVVADETNDALELVSTSLLFSMKGLSSASRCAYLAVICSMSLVLSCVLRHASVCFFHSFLKCLSVRSSASACLAASIMHVSLFTAMNCSTVIVLFSCLHFGDTFLLFMNSICAFISVISSSTLMMFSHSTTHSVNVTIVSMRSMYSL